MATMPTDYTRRLELLLEVCRNLSANLDLEHLLGAIIESASTLAACENSSILAYDKDAQALRFVAAPFYILESMRTMLVPIDTSVAGKVYTTG